jgi:hypothetical protein
MRFCTRVTGEPGENGVLHDVRLAEVSLVGDDHIIGRDAAGYWHIPGGGYGYALLLESSGLKRSWN